MKSKRSLQIGQGLLTIIIIMSFGLIIVNEKKTILFSNKIEEKLDNYILENYPSLKNTKTSSLIVDNNILKKRITSTTNDNYYFEISYRDSDIKDTYKDDYIKGKTYFKYLNKKLEMEVKDKTNINCTITPLNTLNEYSQAVQKKIIEEDNLLSINFYSLKQELTVEEWNSLTITNEIIKNINTYKENYILPKYYIFLINDKKDKNHSVEVSYITSSFIDLDNPEIIINDILNNKKTDILTANKIQYKYL